jgi:hypothetical protein
VVTLTPAIAVPAREKKHAANKTVRIRNDIAMQISAPEGD